MAAANGSVSRTMVSVFVLDKNDNSPVILFPSHLNHSVTVSPVSEPGHTVTKISAIDLDDNENAELRYKLKESSDTEGLFTIESETGEIFLNSDVQQIKGQVFKVRIVVSDLGSPPLKTEALLNVRINGSATGLPDHDMSTDNSGSDQTLVLAVACSCGLLAVITIIVLVVVCRRRANKSGSKKKTRDLFGLSSHMSQGYSIEGLQHATKKTITMDMSEDKGKLSSYENWSEDYTKSVVNKSNALKVIGPEDSYPPKVRPPFLLFSTSNCI